MEALVLAAELVAAVKDLAVKLHLHLALVVAVDLVKYLKQIMHLALAAVRVDALRHLYQALPHLILILLAAAVLAELREQAEHPAATAEMDILKSWNTYD